MKHQSECLLQGHPDKLCDRILEHIIDKAIVKAPKSRIRLDAVISSSGLYIKGLYQSYSNVDLEKVIRTLIRRTGYDHYSIGFDSEDCPIVFDTYKYMVGFPYEKFPLTASAYATNETSLYIPISSYLASALAVEIDLARRTNVLPYLRPDGKVSVTYDYENDCVSDVVILAQHDDKTPLSTVRSDLFEILLLVITPYVKKGFYPSMSINGNGEFIEGGPFITKGYSNNNLQADIPHILPMQYKQVFGLSRTTLTRASLYAARYVARNVVRADLCDKIEVTLTYQSENAKPLVEFNTFATNKVSEDKIISFIDKNFKLNLDSLIKELGLRYEDYLDNSTYGIYTNPDGRWNWDCSFVREMYKKKRNKVKSRRVK